MFFCAKICLRMCQFKVQSGCFGLFFEYNISALKKFDVDQCPRKLVSQVMQDRPSVLDRCFKRIFTWYCFPLLFPSVRRSVSASDLCFSTVLPLIHLTPFVSLLVLCFTFPLPSLRPLLYVLLSCTLRYIMLRSYSIFCGEGDSALSLSLSLCHSLPLSLSLFLSPSVCCHGNQL